MGTYAETFSPARCVREGFLETWRISTDSQVKAGWEIMFQSMGSPKGRGGLAGRVMAEHMIIMIIIDTGLNVCQALS